MDTLKYFSTFSGIGGFELGIKLAHESNTKHAPFSTESEQEERASGAVRSVDEQPTQLHLRNRPAPLCVGFSEIDRYATQIYQRHFPEHTNYGDITKIDTEKLPDFDLLVGGFPCQAFSIAGKRRGFEDTRGTMFFELARILRAKQPRLFVFENVKGLLNHDHGKTFRTIITSLDELGYDLQWQVLNSKNHGVPQNRERVFIIGHLRGKPRPQVFPFTPTEGENTDAVTSTALDANYWKGIDNHGQRTVIVHNIHGGLEETNVRVRRLTPTECERLQGFPDGWTEGVSDTQRYKCCGNAVTVNVIRDIFIKII